MTTNIKQQVCPRRRAGLPGIALAEAGSINQQTVTLGFSLLVLFSLSLLGFFYLQQVLETASQGSEISELENRLLDIKTKQRSVELESAELRSMQNIEGQLNTLNLVTTDRVAYLKLPPHRVAVVPH